MREAAVADALRHIAEGADKWPVRIEDVTFESAGSIGSGSLSFSSPLTIIAGANGAGKSSLLWMIAATLDPNLRTMPASVALKLSGAKAEVGIKSKGVKSTYTYSFGSVPAPGGQSIELEIRYIDTALAVKELQAFFCKFENSEDFTNGSGRHQLEAGEIADVAYISCRDYREITVYEVESGAGTAVVPFFEVTYQDTRYDSRSMGDGELAALYIWWALDQAPRCGILLIEEIESYLSPKSQYAITRFVAATADKKKLFVVSTSHSARVISGATIANTVFASRGHDGAKFSSGTPSLDMLESVGMKVRTDLVVFVEDRIASEFLKRILQKHDRILGQRLDICIKGGESKIDTALREIPRTLAKISFVGVYDGDRRGSVPADLETRSICLPGDKAIEKIFRDVVNNNIEDLERYSGTKNIGEILTAIEGCEHHEWLRELCRRLGLAIDGVLPKLFGYWEAIPGHEAMALAFYRDFQKLVGSEAEIS